MKNILILLGFIFFQFATSAQQRVYKQHGVRTVETKITNTRKPDRSFVLSQTFDKKGNLIEEIKTESTGKIVEHVIYSYEKNKKTALKKDNAGNEIYKEITIKNKDGKTIETSSENFLKHSKESRRYTYDKWGKLTIEVWLNDKNEIDRTKKYFYNNEGLLIQQVSLDEKNVIIFQKDIRYEK
ncbi:MAG: hypothetical protein ACEQSL_01390 [Sediminibacterium sp.]